MKKVIAVACDGEFTAFDIIGGDLIVYAMVEILEDYTLGRKEVFYARPVSTKYFSPQAQDVHGISYWKALEFPSRRESCLSMLNWLKPLIDHFPLEFVYHGNGHLDWRWIKMHFNKEGLEQSILKAFDPERITSTVSMARKALKHLPNHKLNTVAEYWDIPLDHHEALSDASACAQIYCNIKLKKDLWTGELNL